VDVFSFVVCAAAFLVAAAASLYLARRLCD